MSAPVSPDQRHRGNNRCPVCKGRDEDRRGQGKRCSGYTSTDGEWTHCSREEFAGNLPPDVNGLFVHRMHGSCKCGTQHAPKQRAGSAVVATYDYTDESGQLLFQVVRKAGKQFRQRKPDCDGGWSWRLGGVRRVLYRLPALLANPDATVYVVEGEKDADVLARRGLQTTCNPGGAGKWRCVADLARTVLAGRNVVVIPDADDVGREHARQVAASLHGIAKRVVVLPLPTKDASDFIHEGRDVSELVALAENGPEWTPRPSDPADGDSAQVLRLLPPGSEDEWQAAMVMSDEGKPKKESGNCALTFMYDGAWKGAIRYDSFSDRVLCAEMPPLPDLSSERPSLPPPPQGDITDDHDVYASHWLARRWRVSWPTGAIRSGLVYAARHNAFHPLQDYLNACHAKWDRVPRLDTWTIKHLGVPDTQYARRVSSMFLISAVARAISPGCKVDHVLVLEGDQGKGKTTALEIMFGKDWFLPDLPDLRDKDAMHLLAGCWCALADELSAIRGTASIERAKSFFTRTVDVYRPPYGKDSVRRPRTTVFAATTNAPEYLTDETGNRRYWSIKCSGDLDFEALRRDRDQIWGEAMHRYLAGEKWWPSGGDMIAEFRAESELRVVGDEWESVLRPFLAGKDWTTIADCLRELIPDEQKFAPDHQRRVGRCLVRLGYELHRPWIVGSSGKRARERRYYLPEAWREWSAAEDQRADSAQGTDADPDPDTGDE